MSNFSLIKQVNDECKIQQLIKATGITSLDESAQQLLGKAVAQIAAGQDPGSKDPNFVNLLAGLTILSDPDNRDAYNLNSTEAAKRLNLVGDRPDVTAWVAHVGARSPVTVSNIKAQIDALPKMDQAGKGKLIAQLNRLRLAFTQMQAKATAKQKPNVSFAAQQPVSQR